MHNMETFHSAQKITHAVKDFFNKNTQIIWKLRIFLLKTGFNRLFTKSRVSPEDTSLESTNRR